MADPAVVPAVDRREAAAALRAVVDRIRLPVDPCCRELLDALVAVGAERLVREADAPSLDTALANLQTLVDDLVQQARILRFDAIHAPHLTNALARLCPLPPFCG